jgi:Lrp/AsnC family leucine-responsive transcriptional regulator
MRVVAADLGSYERFLQEKLTRVPGIRSIRSRFALRRIIKRDRLPGLT